jgi:hypothetical protein
LLSRYFSIMIPEKKRPRRIEKKIHSPLLIHRNTTCTCTTKWKHNSYGNSNILFTFRATSSSNMTVNQWNVMMYLTYFCICLKNPQFRQLYQTQINMLNNIYTCKSILMFDIDEPPTKKPNKQANKNIINNNNKEI